MKNNLLIAFEFYKFVIHVIAAGLCAILVLAMAVTLALMTVLTFPRNLYAELLTLLGHMKKAIKKAQDM